jgi:hypothetical protein
MLLMNAPGKPAEYSYAAKEMQLQGWILLVRRSKGLCQQEEEHRRERGVHRERTEDGNNRH